MTAQGDGTWIEIRGAWQGGGGDPERHFRGVVVRTALAGLQPGEGVTVAYEAGGGRTPGVTEHGRYILSGPGEGHWLLMSFTCHDTGMPGSEGNDDTAEAVWQARVLPGPTDRPPTGPAD